MSDFARAVAVATVMLTLTLTLPAAHADEVPPPTRVPSPQHVTTVVRTAQGPVLRRAAVRAQGSLVVPRVDAGIATRFELSHNERLSNYSEQRDSIAALTDGGFASVWQEGEFPEPVYVRLQMTDAEGRPRFPPGGIVVSEHVWNVPFLEVVAHPVAGALVTHVRWDLPGTGQVMLDSFAGDGQRRWSVSVFGPVVKATTFWSPAVLADAAGGAFVCDSRTVGIEIDAPMLCQHVDATGQRNWPDPGVVAGGEPGWRVLPTLLPDGAGGLLALWLNKGGTSATQTVLVEGQRFDLAGARLWGDSGRRLRTTALGTVNFYSFLELQAVADGAGGAIFVTEDWNGEQAPSRDVVAQRVSPSGATLWPHDRYLGATGDGEQVDSLTALPDGGALVAMTRFLADLTSFYAMLHALDAQGTSTWNGGDEMPLAPASAGNQVFSSYGTVANGRVSVAYTRLGPAHYDLRLAEFSLAGQRLAPQDGVTLVGTDPVQIVRGLVYNPVSNRFGLAYLEYVLETAQQDTWIATFADTMFGDGFETPVPIVADSRP